MEKKITYIANPTSIHDCKWINKIAEIYLVEVITFPFDHKLNLLNKDIPFFELLPLTYPKKDILTVISTRKKLIHHLKKSKTSIVHSMYPFPKAFWIEDIKFKPHIITTRGSDILIDYKNLLYDNSKLGKFLLKKYNKTLINASYITSTSSQQKELISSYFPEQIIEVIPTGIDVELYEEISTQKINIKPDQSEFSIFSPRSMKEIYNIDTIIKGFSIFSKGKKNVKLIILDDFPNTQYSDLIKKQIQELGLENNVNIYSKRTQKEMIHLYLKSDVIVSIPKSDGTPNSLIEAMLLKKQIISNESLKDNNLFNQVYQLNQTSSVNLANALETFYNHPESDLILKARKEVIIEKASLQKAIEKIIKIYKNCN